MELKVPHVILDGYKFGHRKQYPVGTELIYSNFTARGSRIPEVNKVVFAGLQYFLKQYLIADWNENFFKKPFGEVREYYESLFKSYMGKDAEIEHLRGLHELGYLPLKIKALPEGSRVNLRVPMLTIENTHPDYFWLSNAIETVLSTTLWLCCTSATTAFMFRELLDSWAARTGDPDFVPFQAHDFSMRGHTSVESGCLSAFGHILSFVGSDTVPVIPFVEKYYNTNLSSLIARSIEATEHSVASAGSDCKNGDDFEYFRRMIEDVVPNGPVALVSDTFDFWNVINPQNGILKQLKDKILKRDGKVVIRPDSGDPVKIVTGLRYCEIKNPESFNEIYGHGYEAVKYNGRYFKYYDSGMNAPNLRIGEEIPEVEVKGLIQCLYEIFGGSKNKKGFIELDPHIGAIYGDSITLERAEQICRRLADKGFASTNIVYGVGSFTYQGAVTKYAIVTRDLFGFAVKATYAKINGQTKELYKDPVTDDGLKKSARGLLRVDKDGEDFILKDQVSVEESEGGELKTVFLNGFLLKEFSLEEIRENLKN